MPRVRPWSSRYFWRVFVSQSLVQALGALALGAFWWWRLEQAPNASAFGTSLALLLGFFVLSITSLFIAVRRSAASILELLQMAEALRSTNYETRIRHTGSDELGRLGDSLNQLAAEMHRKVGELNRLENVRRDFVANVSHEIKTPLTSIKGYVETLLQGAIDDPEHRIRFLEKIERNAARLTELVTDILSLARIEATEHNLSLEPVDWSSVVKAVLARHQDAVDHKPLRLTLNLPPRPALVRAEAEGLTQIVENLVNNAIKYTPEGGSITVTLSADLAGLAQLSVTDTGIGIPAEHLERIFERFYRVDKARSRELGGTGLGLAIVKHLVAAMHGEIGVESTLGRGSTFKVKIPTYRENG